MAAEWSVAEVTSTSTDKPAATGAAAATGTDRSTATSDRGTQATSQPAPKWEETPQFKAMVRELQQERTKFKTLETTHTTTAAEVAEWKRKVEALTGIKPPSKDDTDREAILAKLREIVPELGDLGSIKEIREQLERQREQQAVRESTNHSIGIVSQIHKGIAAQMGDLSDKQKESIGALYFYRNFNDPEFHARHVAGDPALVQEFVKDYLDNVYTPIKSKVTDSEARRFRPVPGGKDRSSPMRGEKPIDMTDDNALKAMLANKYRRDRS